MNPVPISDPNPAAVLFAAIAAVCVLSLAGLGLWGFGYQAAIDDGAAHSCVSSPYLMDKP